MKLCLMVFMVGFCSVMVCRCIWVSLVLGLCKWLCGLVYVCMSKWLLYGLIGWMVSVIGLFVCVV